MKDGSLVRTFWGVGFAGDLRWDVHSKGGFSYGKIFYKRRKGRSVVRIGFFRGEFLGEKKYNRNDERVLRAKS